MPDRTEQTAAGTQVGWFLKAPPPDVFEAFAEDPSLLDVIRGELKRRLQRTLGPTGTYPAGQLNPADEGGLQIGIKAEGGIVLLLFGATISWLALPPEQAMAVAQALMAAAHTAQQRGGTRQ